MRALLGGLDALDLELDPIALFEAMNAPIEGQQEFKPVIRRLVFHIISCDDIIVSPRFPSREAAKSISQIR